jgi:hypothetical protein
MKNLKRLSIAVVLACLLGASAFAAEPCVPGQINTPCADGQMAAPGDMGTPTSALTAPGQIETPAEAQSQESFTEIATGVLCSLLSLF